MSLQHHLYESFLARSTTDVLLRVKFKSPHFRALYKLHRVVLIQSGFFRLLFTAGFAESSPRDIQPIDIAFDDPNISRAAFEICISRLYGGGPELYIPASLIPSQTHPLASFPYSITEDVPTGHQLAGPPFLVSLLATSIYLSIPSLASLALSSILNTIGPYTVLQYLSFATGKPIALDYNDSEPAVGLEHIADAVDEDTPRELPQSLESTKEEGDMYVFSSWRTSSSTSTEHSATDNPSVHYGSISGKIGEASVSFLTRWAQDLLNYEIDNLPTTRTLRRVKSFPPLRKVSDAKIDIPVIWRRHGGLSARWVRAIVSSDSLFVKNERHRYDFARSVVELRRQHGLVDEEEKVWTLMFDQSIYYANMTTDDLIHISQDTSPTTNLPFVSLSVLQGANWDQTVLKHQIFFPSPTVPSSPISSPPLRDKELGITVSIADINKCVSNDSSKFYYRVSTNSSLRIGEGPQSTTNDLSMDDLFSLSQSPSKQKTDWQEVISESTFFGLLPHRIRADACGQLDPQAKSQWSPFPPLRFSVEFWDLDNLKEKMRLYSQTVWYAGSLFNVYVQTVKKKGQPQLGIYLHRQSSLDPIPPVSCPVEVGDSSPLQYTRGPSLPDVGRVISPAPSSPNLGPVHFSPSIHPLNPSRSTTPTSLPPYSSHSHSQSRPSTTTGISPAQPYRDPRTTLSAYFTIYCSSLSGNSQTRFSSSPDVFKVNQSWGWKSHTLWGELEGSEVYDERDRDAGKEVSLRATIVLGLV